MVPVGWKNTGVHALSARTRIRMAARCTSEVDLEGEHAAIEVPVGFAPALEVEAHGTVASEREALLESDAARLVALAEKIVETARVGIHTPARCEIDHRSHPAAGADDRSEE